ncbi:MAG TPA: terminase family protein, partial [Clostridia bacterium]|nr:terminase family protein [Clostridia bacterium]
MSKTDDLIKAKRLVDLEKILKARQNEVKLYNYNKGPKKHEKQLEFHKSPFRGRWVFGGNRTGKTECGAVETVWWLRGIHPYRKITSAVHGWIVSPTNEVQRDVAQKKLLTYLPRQWIRNITMKSGSVIQPGLGVIDKIDVESACGGVSQVSFKTCEQGREQFQGASLDFIWFDEEPRREVFDECRMRLMDRLGSFWVTMTPL